MQDLKANKICESLESSFNKSVSIINPTHNVQTYKGEGWRCEIRGLIDLFLAGLGCGLGDLATGAVRLLNGLDNTDSNGLSHVTDGETAKWWVLRE